MILLLMTDEALVQCSQYAGGEGPEVSRPVDGCTAAAGPGGGGQHHEGPTAPQRQAAPHTALPGTVAPTCIYCITFIRGTSSERLPPY